MVCRMTPQSRDHTISQLYNQLFDSLLYKPSEPRGSGKPINSSQRVRCCFIILWIWFEHQKILIRVITSDLDLFCRLLQCQQSCLRLSHSLSDLDWFSAEALLIKEVMSISGYIRLLWFPLKHLVMWLASYLFVSINLTYLSYLIDSQWNYADRFFHSFSLKQERK